MLFRSEKGARAKCLGTDELHSQFQVNLGDSVRSCLKKKKIERQLHYVTADDDDKSTLGRGMR